MNNAFSLSFPQKRESRFSSKTDGSRFPHMLGMTETNVDMHYLSNSMAVDNFRLTFGIAIWYNKTDAYPSAKTDAGFHYGLC